jgi:hypothetical protein
MHKIDLLRRVLRQRRERHHAARHAALVAQRLATTVQVREVDVVDGGVGQAGRLADQGEAGDGRGWGGAVGMQRRGWGEGSVGEEDCFAVRIVAYMRGQRGKVSVEMESEWGVGLGQSRAEGKMYR